MECQPEPRVALKRRGKDALTHLLLCCVQCHARTVSADGIERKRNRERECRLGPYRAGSQNCVVTTTLGHSAESQRDAAAS